jgi:RHS repeat-associated protein
MVQWSAGSSSQQQYVYDASGQRVLSRTTSGGATSLTVYAFGLQELHYHGDGTPVGGTSNCYYYYLGGQLLGKFDGTNTSFFLLDGLGSVVASFSTTAGSAGVLGNQSYEPYGKSQYQQGNLGTSKGYTGQDADSLSGLDYYHARYYDPLAGIFLSPDSVQGNAAGMNPYAYVAGNPETATDPTGQHATTCWSAAEPCGGGGGAGEIGGDGGGTGGGVGAAIIALIGAAIAAAATYVSEHTQPRCPYAPLTCQPAENEGPAGNKKNSSGSSGDGPSGLRFALNSGTAAAYRLPPAGAGLANLADMLMALPAPGGSGGFRGPTISVAGPSSPCSFTSDTQVMTAKGEKAIGDLKVGDKVLAYNPKTHKMELEPILHVWKHTDSDLIDLTLTISTPAHDGKPASTETIHTTSEHPFLTQDQGFTPAGTLKVGMRLMRADGSVGVVTSWKALKATSVMYNLEVAQDHTFVVGDGQWVVHNECTDADRAMLRRNLNSSGTGYEAHHIIPCEFTDHPLVIAAGWDRRIFNSEANGISLPTTPEESSHTALPYHEGSHPDYSSQVGQMLQDAYGDLLETYGNAAAEGFQEAAKSELEKIVESIRNTILEAVEPGGEAVCINDLIL